MSLQYTVETPDGQSNSYGADEIQQQLAQAGYQNAQVNPDGKTISYQINGETYDDEIPSLLETLGHKVSGIAPIQADESFVQPTWRAGLAALPSDDNVRKAYVESNLKKMGMKGEVVGSGDDWYFHNPDTGKWYNTTNAKGFDMTDLIGGGMATPQVLASIVGGGIGAAGGAGLAGPAGAVAGGMAGSAAGDLAGGQLTRALARSFDPELNQVLSEKGGQFGTEDLVSAGISGLGGGIAGLPALAKVMNRGLLTQAAKGVGGVSEAAGTLTSKAGKFAAESPLVTGLTTALTPGLGTVQGAGLLARAGELAPWLNRLVGKGAGKVSGMADDALTQGGLNAEEAALAQAIKSRAANTQVNAMAREVPTNVNTPGSRLNRRIFGGIDAADVNAVEQMAEEAALNKGAVRGFYENVGARLGRTRDMEMRPGFVGPAKPGRIDFTGAGKTAGKLAEAGSNVGRALEGTAEGITKAAFRGVQGAGIGMEKGGRLLSRGAGFAQPWENRILLNQGLQQGGDEAQTLYEIMTRSRQKTPAFSR